MKNPAVDKAGARPPYELGHSERELTRLNAQARLLEPITRRFLTEAGISSGMRVLDVGSGAGDVAFLAADLVGSTGEVIGTDMSPVAITAARERAEARSLRHVSFREGDPSRMKFERPFDAAVGRYVLMFNTDPTAILRGLAAQLNPGGVIVFHELDWVGARSDPPAPTCEQCNRWLVQTLQKHHSDDRMGIHMHSAFVAAGLKPPELRLESIIRGGAGSADYIHALAEVIRTLLPAMERLGVATAAEIDIETLASRMQSEVVAAGSVIVGRSEIGAWSRV